MAGNWVEIASTLILVAMVEYGSALTAAEQQELVNIHTKLRAGEGASNMQAMKWSPELAYMAQSWSDGCVYAHGQGLNSSSLEDLKVGQNLFMTSGNTIDLTSAVMGWFNEKSSYNYNNNGCSGICGHYTQVVWSESNLVGCGYTVCPKGTILTCNYSPAGNTRGVRPYLIGPACTQCSSGSFYCNNDNLCDKDCSATNSACACKAACKNCGTPTTDCRCKCGTGWTGSDCSVVCKNNDDYCGANPGYPSYWCTDPTKTFVLAKCPAMCGSCVGGTPAACP